MPTPYTIDGPATSINEMPKRTSFFIITPLTRVIAKLCTRAAAFANIPSTLQTQYKHAMMERIMDAERMPVTSQINALGQTEVELVRWEA